MARKPDPHELHENLGRSRRAAAGCVDIDPRHVLDTEDNFQVSNRQKFQALLRTRWADGTNVSPHDPVTNPDGYDIDDQLMKAYGLQFEAVTKYIREALTKGVNNGPLKTPQQLANKLNPPQPYFVIEWRIKTVNRDPIQHACGCGCGCGCGG